MSDLRHKLSELVRQSQVIVTELGEESVERTYIAN